VEYANVFADHGRTGTRYTAVSITSLDLESD
jgi:hypothetical protein